MTVLLLDCDGTLADTERDGHLVAFNQAFREFGLPVQWSQEEYGRLLRISGGKERLASLLTPAFVRTARLPTDPAGLQAHLLRWHARKTEIYIEMVRSGRLPPRPGVGRIVSEAGAAGWIVGVVSTSTEASVRSIVATITGAQAASPVALVLAGDVVERKKPAPDIYELALRRLGAPATEAIAIEDSRNGLLAAVAAGVRCVVTVSSYTAEEDFTEAALVVSSLGDPGGERTQVLENRSGARPGPFITLADLEAVLSA